MYLTKRRRRKLLEEIIRHWEDEWFALGFGGTQAEIKFIKEKLKNLEKELKKLTK
jgi:hypothetical protein